MSTREIQLKKLIEQAAIARKADGVRIVSKDTGEESTWLIDFRALLLRPEFLDAAAEVFWERYEKRYPFQIGGLETVGIALVAAVVMKGVQRGTPVNGFYIRKSRKHYGLQKHIEGVLTDDPIILIDDVVNSGASFVKQITTLKEEGKAVTEAFAFVGYREEPQDLGDGVSLVTIFTPADFGLTFTKKREDLPRYDVFSIRWLARGEKPNYFYRVEKSAPAVDDASVYFGTDDGFMYALAQETGEQRWRFKIHGSGSKGKTIFSSPALYENLLFFGAYDGNFYALDTRTGNARWIYRDADWIGSSPAVAADRGLVYVGLEFGLFKKHGGIVALEAATGEKRWEYIEMPSLTHGTPAYSAKYNAVAIGSNNGVLYLFRATDGLLLWQYQSDGEIKSAPAFDEKRGRVIFGSFDEHIHIVDVASGERVHTVQTESQIYSTPLVVGDSAYVSGLDKLIYCVDLDTLDVRWKFQTVSRVFASPALCEGLLYVGSNDGRLYEIDPATGKNLAFFQATERITNKIAYNPITKRFFLPTYANELYCLEKKPKSTPA